MRKSRVDEVYEKIRQGILDGSYLPSQHLVETHLQRPTASAVTSSDSLWSG